MKSIRTASNAFLVVCIFAIMGCGSPDLPIESTVRKALMGPGLVLHLKNKSAKPIEVTIVRGAMTGEKKKIIVPANGSAEFGHKEGFAFEGGEIIRLETSDFATGIVVFSK